MGAIMNSIKVRFQDGGREVEKWLDIPGATASDDDLAQEAMTRLEKWRGISDPEVIAIRRYGGEEKPYSGPVKRKFLVSVQAEMLVTVYDRDADSAKEHAERLARGWANTTSASATKAIEARIGA